MKKFLGSTLASVLAGSALQWSVPAQSPGAAPKNPAGQNAAHPSTPGKLADGGDVPDGIFRHLGETWIMQRGHGEKVERELKRGDGVTIEPNGTVSFKDGHKFKLKENQMATFDGQLKDVTPALTSPDNSAAK